MKNIATLLFVMGIFLTFVGLLAGFFALFFISDARWTLLFIAVPFGFLSAFLGLSMHALHGETHADPSAHPQDKMPD